MVDIVMVANMGFYSKSNKMGLGGELLWTPVIKSYSEATRAPALLVKIPSISDLIMGRLYCSYDSFESSVIFKNNPYVTHPKIERVGFLRKLIDKIFLKIISLLKLKKIYERWIFAKAKDTNRLYLDLTILSYAAKEFKDHFEWKKGGHIIDIFSREIGVEKKYHELFLYFSDDEKQKVKVLLKKENLSDQKFIVIEPHTNTDYFGNLRAWPFERWQTVINKLKQKYPDYKIVQVGTGNLRHLENIDVSFVGKTTFRETCLIIQNGKLFCGTEGGLMHAAYAVKKRSVIVWSGVTEPSFAGYPNFSTIIHHEVFCSPCGRRYKCPYNHECIEKIETKLVYHAIETELEK